MHQVAELRSEGTPVFPPHWAGRQQGTQGDGDGSLGCICQTVPGLETQTQGRVSGGQNRDRTKPDRVQACGQWLNLETSHMENASG